MERKKTKHKGIYKVGKVYYITYYAQGKKHEKAVGAKLQRALDEKGEMGEKARFQDSQRPHRFGSKDRDGEGIKRPLPWASKAFGMGLYKMGWSAI